MSNTNTQPQGSSMTNILLIIVIFVIAAGSFFMANTSDAPEGEAFGGTDSIVTEKLEENGVEPWFSPLIELNSGEIESGLFATQAAIGAGLFGFMIGNLRGRTVQRREQESTTKKTDS